MAVEAAAVCVGKPHGLDRFVCVKPAAVYAAEIRRCSQPDKSAVWYQPQMEGAEHASQSQVVRERQSYLCPLGFQAYSICTGLSCKKYFYF